MKLEIFKSGIKLSGISIDEIGAIMTVLNTANERCFRVDDKQENGDYYSNDDFVCTLAEKQRNALRHFCASFNRQLKRLANQK